MGAIGRLTGRLSGECRQNKTEKISFFLHFAAAEGLPEAQREVFWLRMDAGLAFREIAEVQGCSLGTALARMQYALAKMRTALADDWREFCGGKA